MRLSEKRWFVQWVRKDDQTMQSSSFTNQEYARNLAADLVPYAIGYPRIKEVDFECALDVTDHEPTDHERYEHAERMMLKWTAEEQRLRPALRDEPALPESMCDVSQLKRTFEAAKAWKRWIDDGTGKMPDVGNALYNALAKLFPDLARKEAA